MIHQYTEPFFHVGLICKDVDRTAAEFGEMFGVEFHEPSIFEIPHVHDGEVRPATVRACFSKLGPPYIELFQGDGQGIYQVEGDSQLHHLGLWVPNCAASLERAAKQQMGPDAVIADSDDNMQFWFTDPKDTLGIRFEMIDTGDRDNMEVFLRTGSFPGGFSL
jgi:catechol 2,3-dioxygenase-like lactoylglutathione lyase family enzyme